MVLLKLQPYGMVKIYIMTMMTTMIIIKQSLSVDKTESILMQCANISSPHLTIKM